MIKKIITIKLFIAWVILSSTVWAGTLDPIIGDSFDKLIESQNPKLTTFLDSLFPEAEGFVVSGPINPIDGSKWSRYSRVLCSDRSTLEIALNKIYASNDLDTLPGGLFASMLGEEIIPQGTGYHLLVIRGDNQDTCQLLTLNQFRFMKWFEPWLVYAPGTLDLLLYSHAVAFYLTEIDKGRQDIKIPERPTGFGSTDFPDFYKIPPDYVISGYQNYKDSLRKYSEINNALIKSVDHFTLTLTLADSLKKLAPRIAYPNKEAPAIQHELKKFIERNGRLSEMQTLTSEGFDTLSAGEYFFAVSPAGKIRFGREMLREEVEKIENETGQKPARANHAFLFPGEPILTAGAIFVEIQNNKPLIVKMNSGSGHYFYSNIDSRIIEDIKTNSNTYLLTLGHLLKRLDSLGISYLGAEVSKF